MISDKTIEESTATYWCAFANLKNALDKVIRTMSSNNVKSKAEKAIKPQIGILNNQLNENFFTNFLSKLSPTDPTGGSVGIVGDLTGKSKEQIKANAIAMATAATTAATVLTPAGRNVAGNILKTAAKHPVATGLAVATGKLAADAVSDKDDSWFEKLEKLVNKIWDIGKFTTKYGKMLAVAGTIVFALFKTAPIWMPLLSSTIKSMLRGNSLATVVFDSNGTWYKMRYDIKYKRWELLYKDFSFGSTPSPEETEQLMDTKFFNNFLNQCKSYIEPIVNNENRKAIIDAISEISDKDTQKILNVAFKDKSTLDNMFAMKYKY